MSSPTLDPVPRTDVLFLAFVRTYVRTPKKGTYVRTSVLARNSVRVRHARHARHAARAARPGPKLRAAHARNIFEKKN